jgi:hypothetical protein
MQFGGKSGLGERGFTMKSMKDMKKGMWGCPDLTDMGREA